MARVTPLSAASGSCSNCWQTDMEHSTPAMRRSSFVDVRFEEREALGVLLQRSLKVGRLGVDVAEHLVDVGELDGVSTLAVGFLELVLVEEPGHLDHLPRELHVVLRSLLFAVLLLALLGSLRWGVGRGIVGVVVVADVLALVGGCALAVGLFLGVGSLLRASAEHGVLVLRLVEERATVLVVRLRGLDRLLAEHGGAELEALAQGFDGLLHLVGLDLGDAPVEQGGSLGRGRFLHLVNLRHSPRLFFKGWVWPDRPRPGPRLRGSRVLERRARVGARCGTRAGSGSRRAGLRPARAGT